MRFKHLIPSKSYLYSLLLKVIQTTLSLGLSILLARVLGVSEFGSYAFCMTIVAFVSVFIQIGLPTYLVREISIQNIAKDWTAIFWLYKKSLSIVAKLSIILLTVVIAIWILAPKNIQIEYYKGHAYSLIFLSLILAPLFALNRIHESTLQGLGRVFNAQLSEKIYLPSMLILVTYLTSAILTLTSQTDVLLHAGVLLLVLGINLWFVKSAKPQHLSIADSKKQNKFPYSNLRPFFLISIINLINSQTDILMLGLISSPEQVAVYKIAFTWAAFCTFFMTAIDAVIFPKVAGLFGQRKLIELEALLRSTSKLSFVFACTVFAFLFVFGENLIIFLYGKNFLPAYPLMLILGLGQLINAFVGSVHGVLNLTHNERCTLKGGVVSAILNIILNVVRVSKFGALGAAVSSAFTLVFLNIMLLFILKNKTGLWSAAFLLNIKWK